MGVVLGSVDVEMMRLFVFDGGRGEGGTAIRADTARIGIEGGPVLAYVVEERGYAA